MLLPNVMDLIDDFQNLREVLLRILGDISAEIVWLEIIWGFLQMGSQERNQVNTADDSSGERRTKRPVTRPRARGE
jgi:hypothetical protein